MPASPARTPLYLDDLVVGLRYETGSRTVDPAEAITLVLDCAGPSDICDGTVVLSVSASWGG